MTEGSLPSLTIRHMESESPYRPLTLKNLLSRYRYVILRARHPNVTARLFYLGAGHEVIIDASAVVNIGYGVVFKRDFSAHFAGRVTLEDGVFFNRGCSLVVLNSLVIGAHSIF